MALTAIEIIQVLEHAKKLGVTSLKVEGLEVVLSSQPVLVPGSIQSYVATPNQTQFNAAYGPNEIAQRQPTTQETKSQSVPEAKAEELVAPMSPFEELTDEEITYWATPYFEELQAKKAEMAAKKEPV